MAGQGRFEPCGLIVEVRALPVPIDLLQGHDIGPLHHLRGAGQIIAAIGAKAVLDVVAEQDHGRSVGARAGRGKGGGVQTIGDGFVPLGGWTARGFFDLTVGQEDGTMMIEAPRAEDFAEWARLYAGYAAFYGVEQTDEMRARVWGWISDAGHPVQALVARDGAGQGAGLIGLAHFRPFSRPLSATTGGYLDDLFVDPAVRGTGAGRQLIAGVKAAGRAQGWSVIRWITAQDNARARGLYDAVAQETKWVTYDLKL